MDLRSQVRVRLILFAIFVTLLAAKCEAAFEYAVGSARSFAAAGCPSLFDKSPLDLFQNPSLHPEGKLASEFTYSRLYNLPDFDFFAGAASYSYKGLGIGVAAAELAGSDYYSEKSLLLATSIEAGRRIRIGASANAQRVEFAEGYHSLNLLALNTGLVWTVRSNLVITGAMRNLNRPKWNSESEPLPLMADLSVGYVFSKEFSISALHHFEEHSPDRFSLSQQAAIHKDVALIIGLATQPLEIGGGVSIHLRRFYFDYGFRNNVYLGGTHRFGLRIVK